MAVNFVTNLDPNASPNLPANVSYLSDVTWPKWGSDLFAPPLLTFQDPAPAFNITTDTFREGPMALLTGLALQYP